MTNQTIQQDQDYATALVAELRGIREMVHMSTELAENGVLDSFAQNIQQRQTNPLMAAAMAMRGIEEVLRGEVEKLATRFLRSHRTIIQAIYKTQNKEREHVLEYVLVLKDYTLDNQFAIDEFSAIYQQTGLGDRLPVVMHYIPESMQGSLVNVELVEAFAK